MSFVVHIYYTGQGDNAKLFSREMLAQGIVDTIRQEEGCLRYEYYDSVEKTNEVLLVDEWKSQEALDLHHQSEAMQRTRSLIQKYQLSIRKKRLIEYCDK